MTTIMPGHNVIHRRNNYVKQCAMEHLQPSTPLFPASVLLTLPLVCCCVFEAVSSSSCYWYISCKMVLLTYFFDFTFVAFVEELKLSDVDADSVDGTGKHSGRGVSSKSIE